ncbi:MAG TPA: hypothetical protein VKT82_22235 [Ktedonobacterales bacterium]|nr:hypothetical protein [Ktedonobacterales bacterium]
MDSIAWPSEQALVDNLGDFLLNRQSEKPGRKVKIFREFDPGAGRVDILCVWYNENRLATRQAKTPAAASVPFDLLAGYAMAFLKRCRWVNISYVQAALRLSTAKTERLISVLSERGLAEIHGQKIKACSNQDTWFIEDIEAYEAKLYKWKVAIHQALQHEWFASKSFVVMPEPSWQIRSSLVEQCSEWNIGVLFYQDHQRQYLGVVPPKRRTPMTHIGWYLNERIFEEEYLSAKLRSNLTGSCYSLSYPTNP